MNREVVPVSLDRVAMGTGRQGHPLQGSSALPQERHRSRDLFPAGVFAPSVSAMGAA